ncbi:signal transduction histidine kinase [Kutzneria buriramensis]|uniref:histidine kinase n=1 Tax=Kutzneria buriramensis TaxID=1045776 RepID=A0A3E0HAT5_9PSEU|nr:signal transduction histidine kinase [Kutzneria buriramensis]
MLAVSYLMFLLAATGVNAPAPVWLRILVLAGTALPIGIRRLWPLPVFAFVLTMTWLSVLLGIMVDPFVAAGCCLYVVALDETGRRWPTVLAITGLGATGALVGRGVTGPFWTFSNIGAVVFGALVLGGAWAIGRSVRRNRCYAAKLAEQAVVEERLRIARELHDVVAHSLGVIAVKAGVANHLPDSAPDALRVIEATSREALAEMRRMLGVLRAEEPLRPAPGLDELPELAAVAREMGVEVSLDVRGGPLPDGVDLAVYRIVQEALTNVVKHAAPTSCQVLVDVAATEVRVDVTNQGRSHGLVGMRERVVMFDGSLAAGPRPGGGFAVSARLPYD